MLCQLQDPHLFMDDRSGSALTPEARLLPTLGSGQPRIEELSALGYKIHSLINPEIDTRIPA